MKEYATYFKYIGALLGFIYGHSIWMAFVGYILGSFVGGFFTIRKHVHIVTDAVSQATDSRTAFLRALMVLSAHIIQADGHIMHSEMEAMRRFLLNNFGEGTMQQGNQLILDIFQQKKSMTPTQWSQYVAANGVRMAMMLTVEQRVQLLSFLMDVAKADSHLSPEEVQALRQVAQMMQLNPGMVDQLMGLGGNTLEDAYKVLGLTPQATDDEVRRAYRKLALECHPDRVASLGDDVRRAAEKKFKDITEAKERIYKARGL